MDKIIRVVHKLDGVEYYDKNTFENVKDRLIVQIERLTKELLDLKNGDLISVFEDENDEFEKYTGDSVFYKIEYKSYMIYNGKIYITYWVNDLN